MATTADVIENQFFVGVPWKDIRPKFEGVIEKLRDTYPVHCVIFGRNTAQDADDLWQRIQTEIDASAAAIFDVTGSNPNVSLEFGYAEAMGKQRVLTRYERKPRKGKTPRTTSSIMSDLAGKIRVPYKNIGALEKALRREFDRNPYVVRFNSHRKANHWGERKRKVAVAIVHQLDGAKRMKKPQLVINVETLFPNMATVDVPALIDEMGSNGLLTVKRGRKGGVYMPRL